MSSLAAALPEEIKRNQELKALYDGIPTGMFGSTMIQADINEGLDALASGDVVRMLQAYEKLKDNE